MLKNLFETDYISEDIYLWRERREVNREVERRYFKHCHCKGGGKSGGKLLLGIIGFAVGFMNPAMFGLAGHAFGAGIMGAALFSSIWTSTRQPEMDTSSNSASIRRFNKEQETMSSDGAIPVVYGQRKISGNQTFHQTNADQNTLHKHVVLCEGGIEGIDSVTANELLIPTGGQTGNTVFTITNTKFPNAHCAKSGKTMTLSANGKSHSLYLCNKDDAEKADTFWSWQMSVSSLISYINRLGEGWQCFPVAITSKYPGDLWDFSGNAYGTKLNVSASTVTGGTSFTFHDGDAPDNYDEVGGYTDLAWLDLNFIVSEELNGNPSVSCVVKGRKVYDIRTKETAYSTNPAMCLRDFLLSKRYGLGKWFTEDDLDYDSWAESADYCDEVIEVRNYDNSVTKQKRYELNMVIDAKRSALQWIQEILANFAGYLVYSDAKVKLRIEKKTPVSYAFNDDNCRDLKIEPLKLSDTPNRYEVTIVDPLSNWSTVKCLCEDLADQKMRQKIITKSVSLEGVTSQAQALRLARFYRDYNLVCPLQVSFTTGMQAIHLEPGDVVTISYHEIFQGLPIRIAEIKETEKGTFEINGRQYNDTIYTDVLGGGIQWYNYVNAQGMKSEDIPPRDVRNVKAFTQRRRDEDGITKYDIHVSFDLPDSPSIECGQVYYKTKSAVGTEIGVFDEDVPADEIGWSREWKFAGESPRVFILPRVVVGETYRIRVVAKNKNGATTKLDTAPEIIVKVTPKETVPSQPYNLRYDFSREFLFMWDDVEDSDVIYYELRLNADVGISAGLLGRTSSTSIAVHVPSRTGTAYLYAVNSLKKVSYPVKIDFTYPKPSAPSWILFGDIPRGANISVEDFPQGVKGMRLYIDRKGIDLTSSVYVFHDNPGIYRVSAAYVDLLGEGYRSAEYACTIKPTFDGKWIEDGTLSIAQMDSAVSDALSKAVQSAEDILDIDDAIAGLQESNTEITATLINTKNTLASQIRQTADSINATVVNKEKNLLSQISAQADRISSVVTGLSKNPSESGFSAITQLQDGINLRVKKDDIINQINMTTEGTKIDGKYLHVTGTTKFDNDVITEGMIKAGSITADKLSSSLITLGGEQGIAGGAVTLDAKGLTVRNHDGRMTKFDESGMAFFDRNGNRFSQLGRMLIGEASDGDYVKFGVPWDIVPNIIVVPKQLTLNHPDFPKGIIETRIGATDVSSNGFRVQCQSILGKGSAEGNNILTWSAMILPGKVKPRPYPAPNYKTSEALEVAATLRFSRDFTFSNDATDIVLSGNILTNIRTNPNDIGLVRVQILYEGKAVYDLINFIDVEYRSVGYSKFHNTWVYQGLWDGILPVTRSYWPWNLNTAISLPIKFNESRTVTLKVLGIVSLSQNNNLPTPIYINLFSNQTVDADTVLSRGQAMFIASENNSFYTITR